MMLPFTVMQHPCVSVRILLAVRCSAVFIEFSLPGIVLWFRIVGDV